MLNAVKVLNFQVYVSSTRMNLQPVPLWVQHGSKQFWGMSHMKQFDLVNK